MSETKVYREIDVASIPFETETHIYKLEVKVDSMEQATLKFGNSFQLRADYKNIELLRDALETALDTIETEVAIRDGAVLGEQQPIDFDMNDPRGW